MVPNKTSAGFHTLLFIRSKSLDRVPILSSILFDEKVVEIFTIVSRLARGLPVGSELEYTDDATLMRAMEGRTII